MYQNPLIERYLVIAEKPSVARTIASVLVCSDSKDGYFEGPDGAVSWCFGHLAEYAMPEDYDERYRKWSLEALPIIPDQWKLLVSEDKAKQFKTLKDLLNNPEFSYAVNACDAGREGELIFNRIYELSGSQLPVKRLWISSMEDSAVREGFRNLKNAEEYRNLADASVCRAQADWLVGMNASRAYTKVYNYRFSVGRVQTPTLAMLVDRENEIRNFQKKQFFAAHLLVENAGKIINAVSEHISDREQASRIAGMCTGQLATVSSVDRQTKTITPPRLYDLTTLQRDANRLFGYTAVKTLGCVQNLYENKLITYPRTDSNYLTDDMEQTAQTVISACRKEFPFLAPGQPESAFSNIGRLLNSKKVHDHYAIIPTLEIRKTDLSKLTKEEWNILVLVAARLLCASGKPHIYETVKASFQCCGYTFTASGRSVKDIGWKEIWMSMKKRCQADDEEDKEGNSPGKSEKSSHSEGPGPEDQDLSSVCQGTQFYTVDAKVSEHWTQPPKRFTEDTLLAAMEHAGDLDTEADVERKGLGTPATRAGIIDKMIMSKYAERKKKQVIATDAGIQLISVLPEYLKSAKMTADWENQLLMMERGLYDRKAFMNGITEMLRRMLLDCRQIDERERNRFGTRSKREAIGDCPVCGSPVYEGQKNYYCSNRECQFVLWKENRYLEKMQKKVDKDMAKDLLSKGRTRVTDLYSVKKNALFTADLLMKWKNDRVMFSLDFPRHPSRKGRHPKKEG